MMSDILFYELQTAPQPTGLTDVVEKGDENQAEINRHNSHGFST